MSVASGGRNKRTAYCTGLHVHLWGCVECTKASQKTQILYGTQSFVCGAFPYHLNEVSPGRAVLFLTWRTPLRYRLGKAKGRQKSHFLPFPNLYRQAYYNHNRELRNMYYHIP